jgi:hypothetical protein
MNTIEKLRPLPVKGEHEGISVEREEILLLALRSELNKNNSRLCSAVVRRLVRETWREMLLDH